MINNENDVVFRFRKSIYEDVYKICVENLERTLNGEIKDDKSMFFYRELKDISSEKKVIISDLCKEFIADTVHYFLWMIEQSDEFDLYSINQNVAISLKSISDGLSGELSYVLQGFEESV